jgi:hypothetical protein
MMAAALKEDQEKAQRKTHHQCPLQTQHDLKQNSK